MQKTYLKFIAIILFSAFYLGFNSLLIYAQEAPESPRLEYQDNGEDVSADRAEAIRRIERLFENQMPGNLQQHIDEFTRNTEDIEQAIRYCNKEQFAVYMEMLNRNIHRTKSEYRDNTQLLIRLNHEFHQLDSDFRASYKGGGADPVGGAIIGSGATFTAAGASRMFVSHSSNMHPTMAAAMLIPNIIRLSWLSVDAVTMYALQDDLLASLEVKLHFERVILPTYREHLRVMESAFQEYQQIFDEDACGSRQCMRENK